MIDFLKRFFRKPERPEPSKLADALDRLDRNEDFSVFRAAVAFLESEQATAILKTTGHEAVDILRGQCIAYREVLHLCSRDGIEDILCRIENAQQFDTFNQNKE